uniref:Uncharacterized protein n=1 Tax=Photinus pyralis TaxID=7054 RepID=A0A1Y1MIR1_PHOPY
MTNKTTALIRNKATITIEGITISSISFDTVMIPTLFVLLGEVVIVSLMDSVALQKARTLKKKSLPARISHAYHADFKKKGVEKKFNLTIKNAKYLQSFQAQHLLL